MGSQTIPSRANGQTIDETWFNLFKEIIAGDNFPRNAGGIVESENGSLGSSSVGWLNAYIKTLRLRANSKVISIAGPAALANDYALEMPGGLPSATRPMRISPTGIVTFDRIVTDEITDAAVTEVKRTALTYFLSASSSNFSTLSGTPVDVTNLSLSVVNPNGRPVVLALVADGSGNSYLGCSAVGAVGQAQFTFVKVGVANIAITDALVNSGGGVVGLRSPVPFAFDTPGAGTFTYKVQAANITGSGANVNYFKLLAVLL